MRLRPGEGREYFEHALAEKIFPRAAPEILGAGIDVDEAPVPIDRVERLVHAFEDFDSGRQQGVLGVQGLFPMPRKKRLNSYTTPKVPRARTRRTELP